MAMRFKTFTWPNDPQTYWIVEKKRIAEHRMTDGSFLSEEMGTDAAELHGEGAFFGAQAYGSFLQLENVFQEKKPGILIHPMWHGAEAFLSELRLREEPRENYVAYSFVFRQAGDANAFSAAGTQTAQNLNVRQFCTVQSGQTLWQIASQFGLLLSELLKMNPQIANPGFVSAGEQVRIF